MVDATRWAEYRAGLDELDSELARITEHHDPEDLDDLLYSHLTRLELDGWRARATHVAGADEPVSASLDLITYAHRQLDSQHNGTGLPRGDLERIMDAIRDSVPRTGGNAAPPEAQRRRGGLGMSRSFSRDGDPLLLGGLISAWGEFVAAGLPDVVERLILGVTRRGLSHSARRGTPRRASPARVRSAYSSVKVPKVRKSR
ncbi:hypothetical protein [Pseudonocardia sp. NPDC049154]|uniref:hypothetical protein n=1 Tax=Pseudonocardia sp. NPDC049154 TaxID=3155501 RepID=UPI0033CD9E70